MLESGELAVNRDTQVPDAEFRLAERQMVRNQIDTS